MSETTLIDLLKAERCENCDKTTPLQIHHIGMIRNAHRHRVRNKRTKVLCQDCHQKITNQQINDIRKQEQ
ncbi:hypothetical protein OC686_01855 ['Opuntia sp.' phytoplasma]|uniref:Uncharacterized protein n=1 Tax=Candidatus Phytoplasma asiaticum TaxID=2763338 RepID=A0AAX3B8R4_9MOLU|nr:MULTISPECIES: hypothetical protein [Phytoplasma]MDO8058009.1 hypothetical protein ['Opuntia sp.' phytoplasma]UQV27005.1 hypothetical protein H7686_0001380 ['Parthenium hysterophorus' phyllody phytoplasma]